MNISGFEKFSMVDWDGKVVCTVFTNGCNFRCPFCHNAPLALGVGDSVNEEEIFAYLVKRKNLLDGVVVSGGEPTLHPDLDVFIKKVRGFGYSVKLDTNGTSFEALKSLVEKGLIDYVAMDVKNCGEKYYLTAGVDRKTASKLLENVRKSIAFLKNDAVDYEFRTTLISEFHTLEDMEKIAVLIGDAKRFYLQKYVDRDGCITHGFHAVDRVCAEKYLQIFGNVKISGLRGY